MAAFFLLFHNRRAIRRERVFRDRTDDLDTLNDSQLLARYRFPRILILELTDTVRNLIEPPTQRSHAIPAHIQVMITLRILAKGDYLSEVADIHGVSLASSSRIVTRVTDALCQTLNNINMPVDRRELNKIKERFFDKASFPNVIGAIDGTLIPIQGMGGDDEPNYVCRKMYHAINVQAICDADLRFTNIVVRWPGATHDSFILVNSNVPDIMERTNNGWLLGDSGYPLKQWLMTPILNPQNEQEVRFNKSHCKTRNVIERAFGVLKARFRCLHKTGGSLQFRPPKSCKMIESCFRLHNKAVDAKLPVPDCDEIQLRCHQDVIANNNQTPAWGIRRRLIQRF